MEKNIAIVTKLRVNNVMYVRVLFIIVGNVLHR
jgi:hypothetical protein